MPTVRKTFRMGRVKGYLRGRVWYLCYFENGQRRRPRVGPELDAARRLAAQVNAQLDSGAATALSFEAISIPDLRQRWLDHHEHVLRSSVNTIGRLRAPPTMASCHQAAAWVAGFDNPDDYRPLVET